MKEAFFGKYDQILKKKLTHEQYKLKLYKL